MIGKKINQLATELAPVSTDLTIIGDPTTGVSKKITLAQLGAIFSGAVSFYTNLAAFPNPGTIDVIYCAKDTKKLYLWSGSAYVEVFPSQALLDTYQLRSEKGVSNGYASLDSGGKVPISQLPSSIMEYKGTWNAATNTPTLANGTGDTGDVYICNVAGTVNFGAGPITFAVGDYVIYSGSIWQRSSGAVGTVTSVGASITGDAIGITGSPITTSGTLALAFAGNSTQYVNGAGNLNTFPTLLSSVGLSMPSAFSVANSPLTANGTIAVTGAGNATQYVRGDGQLATLPTNGSGGGASVSYYLNGSINQGTIGGVTYYEMNKTPIIGAGTDFSRSSNGYIASFLTDANDPALLNIPAGNFNFETYFQASSGGGSPTFYIELYQYDGTTFTLIASNSATPKLINDGANIEAYFSALAVPQTTLTLTDRLAVRIYVTTAGRTITLHTENGHLCQVITTFTTGLTALNGLTSQVQYLATGTSGTDFNISSATATHTFNLPTASATNRGALSSADWASFNSKQNAITLTTTGTSGAATLVGATLNIPNYAPDLSGYVPTSRTITINGTSFDLSANRSYSVGTVTSVGLSSATSGVTIGSTPITTSGTITLAIATASGSQQGLLSSTDWTTFNNKQNTLTNPVTGTGTTNYLPKFTGASTIADSAITDNGTTVTLVSRALSGTSASFSGAGLFGGATALTGGIGGIATNGGSFSGVQFRVADVSKGFIYASTSNVTIDAVSGVGFQVYTNASYSTPALGISTTGAATFSSSVTATGNAATTPSFIANNPSGASGTAQHYIDFTAGATVIGRILRGNAASGLEANGLNIDNFSGFKVRLNQLGGSGGSFTIDGGNLGLGVTPSAWVSTWRAIELAGGSIYTNAGGATGQIAMGQNWYYDGSNNRYINSAAASDYYQFGGTHVWRNAPSGTAGNAISFTQAMTLDASGRLIVGATTPIYLKFNVSETSTNRVAILYRGTQAADSSMITTFGTPYLSIGGQENKVDSIQTIGFGFTNGTSYIQPAEIGFQTTSISGYTLGDLVFATRGATTNTAPDVRLRIASTGAATFSSTVFVNGNTVGNGTLSITKNSTFNSEGSAGIVINSTNSASNTELLIGTDGTNNLAYIQTAAQGTSYTSKNLSLQPNGGNVGIGTTNPQAKLHVGGTSGNTLPTNAQGIFEFNSNGGIAVSVPTGNAGGIYFPYSTSAYYAGVDRYLTDLRFTNGDAVRLTIASTGAATFSSTIQTAAPTNGTAQPWKLGNAVSGGVTTNHYIIVEINGTTYTINALQGLP